MIFSMPSGPVANVAPTLVPSDIGTRAVHRALMEAGIRNRVEIWADGGYRHATDVVKLHCMGANRVAFGTLAMVFLLLGAGLPLLHDTGWYTLNRRPQ